MVPRTPVWVTVLTLVCPTVCVPPSTTSVVVQVSVVTNVDVQCDTDGDDDDDVLVVGVGVREGEDVL